MSDERDNGGDEEESEGKTPPPPVEVEIVEPASEETLTDALTIVFLKTPPVPLDQATVREIVARDTEVRIAELETRARTEDSKAAVQMAYYRFVSQLVAIAVATLVFIFAALSGEGLERMVIGACVAAMILGSSFFLKTKSGTTIGGGTGTGFKFLNDKSE